MHNMLVEPQGDESFEACCQWALHNVQIITLLFQFTVQKYISPPDSKVHAGLKYISPPDSKVHAGFFHVSVVHQTLTWTT